MNTMNKRQNKSEENGIEIVTEEEDHIAHKKRRSENKFNSENSNDEGEDLDVFINDTMGFDQMTDEDMEKYIEERWEEEGVFMEEIDGMKELINFDILTDDDKVNVEEERIRKLKDIQDWVNTCLTNGTDLFGEEHDNRREPSKQEQNTCKICLKELASGKDRKIHMNLTHKEYVCMYCDITFDFVRDVIQHTRMIHEVPIQKSAKSFKCDFCRRTFRKKERRDEHMERMIWRKIIRVN